jgi:archaellum component FlaC
MTNLRCLSWRSLAMTSLVIVGSVTINGCGSRPIDITSGSNRTAPQVVADSVEGGTQASDRSENKVADAKPADTESQSVTPTPQKPQLVRTAELSLRLESIDKTMVRLRQIVKSKQGDIYDFQDEQPQDSSGHRQTTLTLKVPSNVLDATLAEIAKLGRVESQGIKSEDVTQQLVDTDARLKNLRQQEDLTRKIMDRSGSVKDILAVSKELSAIREQIEQLDATVKNLRQQVAYSTINLKIEESQSANPTSDGFGVQVGETWKNSTHAAGSLATHLALGLLWLLPFTPFIGVVVGGVYYIIRRRRQVPVVEAPQGDEG